MPDLKKWDSERLCNYHEKLIDREIEKPERLDEINVRRSEIRAELERRALKNEFIRPKAGMLSFYGYRVGRTNGKKQDYRRKTLTKIYQEQNLPIIGRLLYVQEWGEPESNERLQKMKNCLIGFLNGDYPAYFDMEKAFQEWRSDLNWLDEEIS